jgi:hypothetical protein
MRLWSDGGRPSSRKLTLFRGRLRVNRLPLSFQRLSQFARLLSPEYLLLSQTAEP